MKNGVMTGIVAGTLMGAGALWAMNNMSKGQKRQLNQLATQAANKVMEKTSDLMGK